MKKYLLFLALFMVILSLVSCSFEPIVTTYIFNWVGLMNGSGDILSGCSL